MKQKRYFIWGTGYVAENINRWYGEQLENLEIAGYIDNDLQKQGMMFAGKRVFGPDILVENKDSYIIIANTFEKEIKLQIERDYPWMINRIMEPLFFQRQQLISRYKNSDEKEIQDIMEYLENNPLEVFNYPFTQNYAEKDFYIGFDRSKGLFYTYQCNKKMYFSRDFKTVEKVRAYYKSICIEQDMDSPHRYLTDTFVVPEDAVVIDAGAAEGNFALSVIDHVKKIYLFEPDDRWAEALAYTFEPYKNKVNIINKNISNYIDNKTTTIDKEISESEIDFIKMDIEGEEYYALEGARKTITASENMRCAICTYHQEFAYDVLSRLLLDYQFTIETSAGYMWYFNEMRPAILRRGIIRAKKGSYDDERQ